MQRTSVFCKMMADNANNWIIKRSSSSLILRVCIEIVNKIWQHTTHNNCKIHKFSNIPLASQSLVPNWLNHNDSFYVQLDYFTHACQVLLKLEVQIVCILRPCDRFVFTIIKWILDILQSCFVLTNLYAFRSSMKNIIEIAIK